MSHVAIQTVTNVPIPCPKRLLSVKYVGRKKAMNMGWFFAGKGSGPGLFGDVYL